MTERNIGDMVAASEHVAKIDQARNRAATIDQQQKHRRQVASVAEYMTAALQIDPVGIGLIVALEGNGSCRTNLEAIKRWVEQRGMDKDPAAQVAALRAWLNDRFDV